MPQACHDLLTDPYFYLHRRHGDLTKSLLSALVMVDETHSGPILFACVDNSYLLLHLDRICSECSGRSF
jgi:hypothetical protein